MPNAEGKQVPIIRVFRAAFCAKRAEKEGVKKTRGFFGSRIRPGGVPPSALGELRGAAAGFALCVSDL
jgi:hypothetical protein